MAKHEGKLLHFFTILVLVLRKRYKIALSKIHLISKNWPKTKNFIEGAYKLFLFAKHIPPKIYSVIEFLEETNHSMSNYLNFSHQSPALLPQKKDASTSLSPKSPKKILPPETATPSPLLLDFEEILKKRIFLPDRYERMERALKSHNLIKPFHPTDPIPSTCIEYPSDTLERQLLSDSLFKMLSSPDDDLWHDIYTSVNHQLNKIDSIRQKHMRLTNQIGACQEQIRSFPAQIEGEARSENANDIVFGDESESDSAYAQISDYFCSLTTVKYILECANIKEDIEKEVRANRANRNKEEHSQTSSCDKSESNGEEEEKKIELKEMKETIDVCVQIDMDEEEKMLNELKQEEEKEKAKEERANVSVNTENDLFIQYLTELVLANRCSNKTQEQQTEESDPLSPEHHPIPSLPIPEDQEEPRVELVESDQENTDNTQSQN